MLRSLKSQASENKRRRPRLKSMGSHHTRRTTSHEHHPLLWEVRSLQRLQLCQTQNKRKNNNDVDDTYSDDYSPTPTLQLINIFTHRHFLIVAVDQCISPPISITIGYPIRPDCRNANLSTAIRYTRNHSTPYTSLAHAQRSQSRAFGRQSCLHTYNSSCDRAKYHTTCLPNSTRRY